VKHKNAAVGCALLAMSTPAFAQNNTDRVPRPPHDFAEDSGIDAGVANLMVRTAFTPSPTLSRQELFGLLLLMSVPRDAAHNSMQGAKP
jgi:hypothetical protein